ncbi:hypothetical protein KCU65_g8509, partial [Aureobasidium melanogenum]
MSIKRQNNNTPACIDGDTSESGGPYQGLSECEDKCYLIEKSGERVGQICTGYCDGTGLVTGQVVYNCFSKA